MTEMTSWLEAFLAQKTLSDNSRQAYTYDLTQFCQLVGGDLTGASLSVYRSFLSDLSLSAQKRKCSAVNQYLYYLYQTGLVAEFHKISPTTSQPKKANQAYQALALLDWSAVYEPVSSDAGQVLTLLILELGLTPSEILALRVQDIDVTFRVIRLTYRQEVRILPLPDALLPHLSPYLTGDYLFDRAGKPYTRQWLSNQLNRYLTAMGRSSMTAQTLREQYILRQVAKGVSQTALAGQLGLKTTVTLEKYYQVNGY